MSRTNDVLVALQYRGSLSVGNERQRLGYAAFHWSILIQSAQTLHQFDVTDGIILDPETGQNLNKDEDWIYRHNRRDTTADIARYLGGVKIGRLKRSCSANEVHELFEKLPTPVKDSLPKQDCTTWAASAIQALQNGGIVQTFEIPSFMDYALRFGDDRIAKFTETPEVVDYLSQNSRRRDWFSIFR